MKNNSNANVKSLYDEIREVESDYFHNSTFLFPDFSCIDVLFWDSEHFNYKYNKDAINKIKTVKYFIDNLNNEQDYLHTKELIFHIAIFVNVTANINNYKIHCQYFSINKLFHNLFCEFFNTEILSNKYYNKWKVKIV